MLSHQPIQFHRRSDANNPNAHWLSLVRSGIRTCRAKGRLELCEACASLKDNPNACIDAYVDALLRAISQGMGEPLVIHQTGAREQSFDERWLIALLEAASRGDNSSLGFMLRTRLSAALVPEVRWLLLQIHQSLSSHRPTYARSA